jgi:microcystin-dependent protein
VRRQGTDTLNGGTADYKLSSRFAGARFAIDIDVEPDNWVALPFGVAVGDATPVGLYADFPGSAPPAGWLVRNGAAVSRTTYADLFAAIGTTFGAGDGSTTFNLPNDIGGQATFSANKGGGDPQTLAFVHLTRITFPPWSGCMAVLRCREQPVDPAPENTGFPHMLLIASNTSSFTYVALIKNGSVAALTALSQAATATGLVSEEVSASGTDYFEIQAYTTASPYQVTSTAGHARFQAEPLFSVHGSPCIKAFNGVTNPTMLDVGEIAADVAGHETRIAALEIGGYLRVQEEQPSGTGGGTPSTGWQTRVLNAVKTNTIDGASLASNTITLPAGTYKIEASAPGFSSTHQLRLYNIAQSAAALVGTSTLAGGDGMRSFIKGVVTFPTATQLRLDHYFGTSNSGALGKPASSGNAEIYSEVFIEKVA